MNDKKKFPGLTVILGVVGVILLILGLSIFIKVGINHSFISQYNKKVYAAEKEQALLVMNVPESYLPYYNLGNAAYKNGDYNSAIAYYNQALQLNPPKGRECDIRINLALSMVYTIDFNHLDSQDKINTALIILYKARDVLLEKGCAAENPEDAHNATAQQLKEDIDKLIEMLENPEKGGGSGDEPDTQQPSEGSGDDPQQPSSGDDKMKNRLRKQQKDALDEKTEQQEDLEKGYNGGRNSGNKTGSSSDSGYTNPW